MDKHFTAWVTNDTSCLVGKNVDVTVLADEIVGFETDSSGFETDTPKWGCAGDDPLMHAETTVDAKDGDIDDALREAKELLEAAGWAIDGEWDVTPTSYVVTVIRT